MEIFKLKLVSRFFYNLAERFVQRKYVLLIAERQTGAVWVLIAKRNHLCELENVGIAV